MHVKSIGAGVGQSESTDGAGAKGVNLGAGWTEECRVCDHTPGRGERQKDVIAGTAREGEKLDFTGGSQGARYRSPLESAASIGPGGEIISRPMLNAPELVTVAV